MSKYLLPILAIIGAFLGLLIVFWSQKESPVPPILFPPPKSPYVHAIAGAGIIEASSQNISIGSPFNEIVTKVYVVEGDQVKVGDPLFEVDVREFKAQKKAARASLATAETILKDKKTQFSFYQNLKDPKAVSQQLYQQAYYALLQAEDNVKSAQATLLESQVNIQKSRVKAPIDGTILQVNLRVGEIAPVIPITSAQSIWRTASQGGLMLMGSLDPLQVRVDIDEEDSWRYEKGAPATAFVRGNSHINFPLHFVRVEPYVIPKSSFTGATTERVDTRVLQVLYTFEKQTLPVYAGQVLDIYIKSKPYEAFDKK